MATKKNSARASKRAGSKAAGKRAKGGEPSSKRRSAPAVKGRPSKFSPELVAELCRRMIAGQSLRQVCAADDMPDKVTVLRWLSEGLTKDAPKAKQDFCTQYARAREALADDFAEGTVQIADESMQDAEALEETLVACHVAEQEARETKDDDAERQAIAKARAAVEGYKARQDARRLQIDARKWAAPKLAPKKYGSKLEDGVREAVGDSLAELIGALDGQTRGL